MTAWDAWMLLPLGGLARAQATWQRVQDRPTEIVLRRAGISLPEQTVRVEYLTAAREDDDIELNAAAQPGVGRLLVFGLRDHPSLPTTDIQRGDRFILNGAEVEVLVVIHLPGEVQAVAEVRE